MFAHQGTDYRTPVDGYQNNATSCNKMSDIKRNCTLQVRSVLTSNSNVTDDINSITPELLCSSNIYPPNKSNNFETSDIDASNNYWRTEDIPVLADIADISNGPTVQLRNIFTVSST